jgi:hypothetical protein
LETDVLDVDKRGYYWRVGPYFRKKIKNPNSYLEQAEHIWTHSEYTKKFENIISEIEKLVYIVRHPLAVSKSQANFAFTPYVMNGVPHKEKSPAEYFNNRLEWSTRSWAQNVSCWLANLPENSHVIFYENLKNNFDDEYTKLLNYLEIDLTNEQFETIKKAVTKQSMGKKNKHHVSVNKPKINVSEKQEQLVLEITGPLLETLGYSSVTNTFLIPQKEILIKRSTFAKINEKQRFSLLEILRAAFSLITSKRTLKNKFFIAQKKFLNTFK